MFVRLGSATSITGDSFVDLIISQSLAWNILPAPLLLKYGELKTLVSLFDIFWLSTFFKRRT